MLGQVVTKPERVLTRDTEDSDPFDAQLLVAKSRVFGEVKSSSLPPPAVFKRKSRSTSRGPTSQPYTTEKLQTASTSCDQKCERIETTFSKKANSIAAVCQAEQEIESCSDHRQETETFLSGSIIELNE